jgi:asparagine synthase (glutamine-hydrolysing)
MTWDGRLDNRDDLLLQLWRDLRDETTDVALAMTAYEKWGEDSFARLIGDWSLVLWDNQRQALTFGSDYAANRGLFYVALDQQIVWSSSLRVLVELTARQYEIDPRFVVGYLTAALPPAVTPYKEVVAVLPAHAITWTRTGVKSARRVWDLSVGSLRRRDAREYEIQLRLLLRESVRARLRAIRPVWAELSGGFDSSAVVCMADQLVRCGNGNPPRLETVSYFTNQAPASGELRFIEAVEQQCDVRGHRVLLDIDFGSIDQERQWITPLHPSGVALREYQCIRDHGGRVLLSGAAGDSILGNIVSDPSAVLGRLLEGHIVATLREARAWSRACQRPIWGIAHESLSHLASHVLSVQRVDAAAAEAFLLPATLTELWLGEVRRRAARKRAVGQVATSTLLTSILGFIDTTELQAPTEFPGVGYSLPFMHRPLVEFVLALPAGALFAPGEPRALMKRAFRDILPSRVVERISKGYVVEPFRQRAVRDFAVSNVNRTGDLHVVKHGYVDDRKLSRALTAIASGGTDFASLRQIVKLETWLQALSAHRANTVSSGGAQVHSSTTLQLSEA